MENSFVIDTEMSRKYKFWFAKTESEQKSVDFGVEQVKIGYQYIDSVTNDNEYINRVLMENAYTANEEWFKKIEKDFQDLLIKCQLEDRQKLGTVIGFTMVGLGGVILLGVSVIGLIVAAAGGLVGGMMGGYLGKKIKRKITKKQSLNHFDLYVLKIHCIEQIVNESEKKNRFCINTHRFYFEKMLEELIPALYFKNYEKSHHQGFKHIFEQVFIEISKEINIRAIYLTYKLAKSVLSKIGIINTDREKGQKKNHITQIYRHNLAKSLNCVLKPYLMILHMFQQKSEDLREIQLKIEQFLNSLEIIEIMEIHQDEHVKAETINAFYAKLKSQVVLDDLKAYFDQEFLEEAIKMREMEGVENDKDPKRDSQEVSKSNILDMIIGMNSENKNQQTSDQKDSKLQMKDIKIDINSPSGNGKLSFGKMKNSMLSSPYQIEESKNEEISSDCSDENDEDESNNDDDDDIDLDPKEYKINSEADFDYQKGSDKQKKRKKDKKFPESRKKIGDFGSSSKLNPKFLESGGSVNFFESGKLTIDHEEKKESNSPDADIVEERKSPSLNQGLRSSLGGKEFLKMNSMEDKRSRFEEDEVLTPQQKTRDDGIVGNNDKNIEISQEIMMRSGHFGKGKGSIVRSNSNDEVEEDNSAEAIQLRKELEEKMTTLFGLITENCVEKKWENVIQKEKLEIYKKITPGNPSVLVRCDAVVQDCSVEEVFLTIYNAELRKQWDKVLLGFQVIEIIDENTDVIYFYVDAGFGVDQRDFLQRRIYQKDCPKKGEYIIMYYSITHPLCPPKGKGWTRAHTYIAGYYIRECPKDAKSTSLGIITQCDIKGLVPQFIVNSIAAKAPGDWVKTMKKGCEEYRKRINGQQPTQSKKQ